MSTLPDTMSLGEARQWLRSRYRDGERCPCCKQMAKLYKRTVNAQMARALVVLARNTKPGEYAHWPTLLRQNGVRADEAKLRYWALVEEEAIVRPDGGRSGWWRVTDLGRQFLAGAVSIDKYALVYDGQLRGFDGKTVTIRDCLGKAFDLRRLMDGDA